VIQSRGLRRRIFRPKEEEVAGGWRRLHNEELHNFTASPNIIKVNVKWYSAMHSLTSALEGGRMIN
jgi:hypothetical protein